MYIRFWSLVMVRNSVASASGYTTLGQTIFPQILKAVIANAKYPEQKFSWTSLEPTGKSEFSKSGRFGPPNVPSISQQGRRNFYHVSHWGELIAPRGISMCKPTPVGPLRGRDFSVSTPRGNAKYFDVSVFLPVPLLSASFSHSLSLSLSLSLCTRYNRSNVRHFSPCFLWIKRAASLILLLKSSV